MGDECPTWRKGAAPEMAVDTPSRLGEYVAIRGFFERFLSSVAALAVVLGVLQMGAGQQRAAGTSSFVAGIYGAGASDQVKAAGFNTINISSPTRSALDSLAAKGFKAVVWLGEYDRGNPCQFEFSDSSVRSIVGSVAGHPAIAAYQLSDEPNYARLHCANAVQQHKDRAALIKSVDPSKPTYLTISTWDGREGYPYQYFAGVADIMGLDVYPCTFSGGCNFGIIDTAIRQAALKGVTRYWAIVQDFADSYYRVPTASELKAQFVRWAPSNLTGYFVYHWGYGNIASRPDHLAVLADAPSILGWTGTAPAPAPPSSPTPTTSPSASPTPLPTATTLLPQRLPAGTVVARDSFGGDGAGWGTADTGGAWVVVSGSTSAFTRSGSQALLSSPMTVSMAAILGVLVRDVDATVTLSMPDVSGSGNLYGYMLLRRASSSSNMRVGLYLTPAGDIVIRGQDAAGQYLFPDVATGLTSAGGEALRLRVLVTGSSPTTIRVRAWKASASEPSAWAVTSTSSLSGIQGAGAIGLRTINYSSAGRSVVFDDLLVRAA
jgi:hypothetical protein